MSQTKKAFQSKTSSFDRRVQKESSLTADEVRDFLLYDPETGVLTWKEREPTTTANKVFNTRFSGKPAGWINVKGYMQVGLLGKRYFVHRIAWLIMTGEWPPENVDHRNGIGHDNRWEFLRSATHVENSRNRAIQKNSESSIPGVTYCKTYKKWVATIWIKSRAIHLGRFLELSDAIKARKSAEITHYGEFSLAASRRAV